MRQLFPIELFPMDGILVSDWIARTSSVSRSTFYELIKICGIEPEKRRVPGSRAAQSYLSFDQEQELNHWASLMAQGANLTMIRDKVAQIQSAMPPAARTVSQAPSNTMSMVKADAGEIAVADSEDDVQDSPGQLVPAGLDQAIQKIQTCVARDGVLDPLAQARQIQEAIELEAELTDLQLALLIGEELDTVTGWGSSIRKWSKRIRLCPSTVHGQRRWMLERIESKTQSTDSVDSVQATQSKSADIVQSSGRRPGFMREFEPDLVEARSQLIDVTPARVQLFPTS